MGLCVLVLDASLVRQRQDDSTTTLELFYSRLAHLIIVLITRTTNSYSIPFTYTPTPHPPPSHTRAQAAPRSIDRSIDPPPPRNNALLLCAAALAACWLHPKASSSWCSVLWAITIINPNYLTPRRPDTSISTSTSTTISMALPALLLPVLLVAAALLLLLVIYLLFFRGPPLGDDWPRVTGCRVEERGPDHWPNPPPPQRLKEITPAEYRTLCALCDTFLPAFVDEAEVRAGARAYVEELLRGDAVTAAQREAMIGELTRDLGFYKYGALEAGVPLKVADVIEAQVPPGELLTLHAPAYLRAVWHVWCFGFEIDDLMHRVTVRV
jgi:hypothetical protein